MQTEPLLIIPIALQKQLKLLCNHNALLVVPTESAILEETGSAQLFAPTIGVQLFVILALMVLYTCS